MRAPSGKVSKGCPRAGLICEGRSQSHALRRRHPGPIEPEPLLGLVQRILDRILAGPESITPLVDGKFLFLVVQGFAQILVIFVIAWIVYGVDLPRHLLSWSITTAVASAAAAGLALTVATACRTLRQAQTLSNIAILVLSALGGSMVPRFFMPEALQDLGWITPNTWAIEAYTAAFWRNDPFTEMLAPWAVLAFTGLVGLLVARRLARRLAEI